MNGVPIMTRDGFGTGPLRGTRMASFRNRVRMSELAGDYTIMDSVFSYPYADVTVAADGTITGGGFVIDADDPIEPGDWEVYGVRNNQDYASVYKFRR